MNAGVMLTVNIHLQDKLVNGQSETVMHIVRSSQSISKIYLKLDDRRAGVKVMNADLFVKRQLKKQK